MFLISACRCLCAIYWSQTLSGVWRCSWSSAGRRCSNYIWVINNSIVFWSATYIRDLMVDKITHPLPNFNGCTVEFGEWISNFITHLSRHVDYLSLLGLKLNHANKGGLWRPDEMDDIAQFYIFVIEKFGVLFQILCYWIQTSMSLRLWQNGHQF